MGRAERLCGHTGGGCVVTVPAKLQLVEHKRLTDAWPMTLCNTLSETKGSESIFW